jgi:hypothetical protein
MLLIGMIGFTALASTTVTEQKQKIEIVKGCEAQTIVDIVFTMDLNIQKMFDKECLVPTPVYLRFENEPITFQAIITDVGWPSSKRYVKEVPYTEKLLENYNLDFRQRTENPNSRIRDNC